MPRINAKKLVERALKREGGKKQVDVAQAMELFGAICFELWEWYYRYQYTTLEGGDDMIERVARAHAKRRKIKVDW